MKPGVGEFFVVFPAHGRSRGCGATRRAFRARPVTVTECFDNPNANEANLVFVRASLSDDDVGSDAEEETCALHPKPREGGGQRATRTIQPFLLASPAPAKSERMVTCTC